MRISSTDSKAIIPTEQRPIMRQRSTWANQAELFRSPEAVQHQGRLRLSSHWLRSIAAKERFILVSGRKPEDFRGLGHFRDYSGADGDAHEADSSSRRRNSRVRRGFLEAWRGSAFGRLAACGIPGKAPLRRRVFVVPAPSAPSRGFAGAARPGGR